MRENLDVIARELVDGDSVDLPDGRSIRLRLQQDEFASFADWPDCYGRVEYAATNRMTGYKDRPEWADGAARKIWAGNDCFWWQPPADIISNREQVGGYGRMIHELLIYGWQDVIVEILDEGTDAYGSPVVREYNSIGGVEWHMMNEDDRASLLADILADLNVMVAA
jgi:hypothetical protein